MSNVGVAGRLQRDTASQTGSDLPWARSAQQDKHSAVQLQQMHEPSYQDLAGYADDLTSDISATDPGLSLDTTKNTQVVSCRSGNGYSSFPAALNLHLPEPYSVRKLLHRSCFSQCCLHTPNDIHPKYNSAKFAVIICSCRRACYSPSPSKPQASHAVISIFAAYLLACCHSQPNAAASWTDCTYMNLGVILLRLAVRQRIDSNKPSGCVGCVYDCPSHYIALLHTV